MGSYKKPDDQVTQFSIYYRKYREAKKNGTYVPSKGYTPAFTKEDLNKYGLSIEKADNEFGWKVIQKITKEHECKISLNNYGYLYINIYDEEKMKMKIILLHRLLYVAFIGDIPQGYTVDHIDCNKLNNNLDNLQLLTRGANTKKSDAKIINYGRNQHIKTQEDAERYKAKKEAYRAGVEARKQARKAKKEAERINTLEIRKDRLIRQIKDLRKRVINSKRVHGADSDIYHNVKANAIEQLNFWIKKLKVCCFELNLNLEDQLKLIRE